MLSNLPDLRWASPREHEACGDSSWKAHQPSSPPAAQTPSHSWGSPGAIGIPPLHWLNLSPPFCLINKIKGCTVEGEELGHSLETGELKVRRRNVRPPESLPATGLPFPRNAGDWGPEAPGGLSRHRDRLPCLCRQHQQRYLPASEKHSSLKHHWKAWSTSFEISENVH